MKVHMKEHEKWPGWFTLDYRPNGAKGVRVREHYETWQAAHDIKVALEGQTPAKTVFPRLEQVVEEYMKWCEDPAQGGKATVTLYNKRNRLIGRVIPALGRYRVRDLSPLILDGYTRGLTKFNATSDLNHLKALIKWMVTRRYAEPLTWHIEMPTLRRTVKRLPPTEDIVRLVESLHIPRHRAAAYMMLLGGLRWNETAHLKWDNYRGDTILLEVTKTGEDVVVSVPEQCREWLEENKGKGRNAYIFGHPKKNTPPSRMNRVLLNAMEKTGVKLSPHMLRHASATTLYDLTEDIYAVQHHLRHANIENTKIYTRYSEVRRRKGVEALSDAFKVDKTGPPAKPHVEPV